MTEEPQVKPIRITFDEAVAGLRRAVELKGDEYHYDYGDDRLGCYYFRGDEPACIVGHLLSDMGVTPDRPGFSEIAVDSLVGEGFLQVDDRTRRLLVKVQDNQDEGESWGFALGAALSCIGLE